MKDPARQLLIVAAIAAFLAGATLATAAAMTLGDAWPGWK